MKSIDINKVMFLDIETATNTEELIQNSEDIVGAWMHHCRRDSKEKGENFGQRYTDEGALHPEFARIVCICTGVVVNGVLVIKSISDPDEKVILQQFLESLEKFQNARGVVRLCAHYGIGFDFPFIIKRLLINGMEVPAKLKTFGKKPWELDHIDTSEVWKMGGFGSASLKVIAMIFWLPSPKDDIDGSEVSAAFHAGETPRIVIYCQKDVKTLANVFQKMRTEPIFTDDMIQIK